MPVSILLGRSWPAVGEPWFLPEDTNTALALHELERQEAAERCPSCGLPKETCRAKANQFRFVAEVERCHATYAMHRASGMKDNEASDRSLQVSAHLRH